MQTCILNYRLPRNSRLYQPRFMTPITGRRAQITSRGRGRPPKHTNWDSVRAATIQAAAVPKAQRDESEYIYWISLRESSKYHRKIACRIKYQGKRNKLGLKNKMDLIAALGFLLIRI